MFVDCDLIVEHISKLPCFVACMFNFVHEKRPCYVMAESLEIFPPFMLPTKLDGALVISRPPLPSDVAILWPNGC